MEWGEQVNRLSIHSLSLSNNPGLPWKPLYACSLITLTPYTYSLIHTETHTKTQKRHKHTHFLDWQSPSPFHAYQHSEPSSSHTQLFHQSSPVIFDAEGFGLILTAGTRSFLTSLMARWSLILARLCVSSTVIRTWRSSLRCSQLGFPRFISSWNTKKGFKGPRLNAQHRLGPLLQRRNRI